MYTEGSILKYLNTKRRYITVTFERVYTHTHAHTHAYK